MRVGGIASMVFLLIIIYYIFRNPKETVSLINALAGNAISGVKTLQGR